MCRLHYNSALASVLEEHPWTFATVMRKGIGIPVYEPSIESDSNSVELNDLLRVSGYTWRTPIPANTVHLWKISDVNGRHIDAQSVVRNNIFCNVEDIFLTTTIFEEDTTIYPIGFINCLTYQLAMRLTKSLIDSVNYQQQMREMYATELLKAIMKDMDTNPTVDY
jgi:hypothetical protein